MAVVGEDQDLAPRTLGRDDLDQVVRHLGIADGEPFGITSVLGQGDEEVQEFPHYRRAVRGRRVARIVTLRDEIGAARAQRDDQVFRHEP
jgi:hypothetical protein